MIAQIQPEKAWIIHISHYLGLAEDVQKMLPDNVTLGYDGLVIACD